MDKWSRYIHKINTDYSQIDEESQKQSIEYFLKYIAKTKKVEVKSKLETPQEKYNALFPKKGDLEFYNPPSSEVTTAKAPKMRVDMLSNIKKKSLETKRRNTRKKCNSKLSIEGRNMD